MVKCDFRVGFGFDVHRLVKGRELWLCGVKLPHDMGLLGHSDADVAAHALSDAFLGAAALRDIGYHFPDSDPAYKGADSMKLLAEVCQKLRDAGWEPVNVDMTICAEKPKLSPHISAMQTRIAEVTGLEPTCVSIKATTTEGLGYTGRCEGIAAQAVALICRI